MTRSNGVGDDDGLLTVKVFEKVNQVNIQKNFLTS